MIKAPPESYRGSIADFVDAFVVPNLPPADVLLAWTTELLAYHALQDAVCIVRGRAGNRGAPRRSGTLTIVESDNSPGRWCYLRALDGGVLADRAPAVLRDGELPVLYAASREERENWSYGQAMKSGDKQLFSVPRLKHCHIEDALNDAPDDPRVRALRNLCPINHFLWPMPKHFTMRRVGWSEPSMRSDLGESRTVISHVQTRLAEYLGPAAREVYKRYLDAVGGRLRRDEGHGLIEIEPKPTTGSKPHRRAVGGNRSRDAERSQATRSGRSSDALWRMALRPATPLEAARLMAEHHNAAGLTKLLFEDGCTPRRIVAMTNAMYNPCRPAKLRKKGLPVTAKQAWATLFERRDDPHSAQRSKWRPLVAALDPMPADVEAQIRRMSILELGALAASMVKGPYALMESA